MIGEKIAHYTILEKLGEGGMGVVYKARDTKLDRIVALKFLPSGLTSTDEEKARFVQEARAASVLNHPHVCTVYDLQEFENQQFIVMEFVDGTTMRSRIGESGLGIEEAIEYAIQIAEALEEAHSKGIVHRDIKSENIMVTTKNQVKVLDFGLAKLRGSLKLTRTSSTLGTLAYMSPEQIRGGEVDARSDIFSFGVVLYEMLSGHLPFRGEHEAALLYSIVNEEPEPIETFVSDASTELGEVLSRAIEKNREERYQSIDAILIDLRRFTTTKTGAIRPGVLPEMLATSSTGSLSPTKPRPRLHKSQWFGIIVALCLTIASIVFFWTRQDVRLNPHPVYTRLKVPFTHLRCVSLSSDGKWIAFPASDAHESFDVYVMNTAGNLPNKVTRDEADLIESVDISPDVSQLVYDAFHKSSEKESIGIRVVSFQGGAVRTIADTGICPRWSPSGWRIAYIRAGRKLFAARSGKFEIWSVSPDGTDNRLEFIDTIRNGPQVSCCWSPDGRSIAWVRNVSQMSSVLMVRELGTGKERQVTSETQVIDEIDWGSNGMILFTSNRSGNANLWIVPSTGSTQVQVTQGTTPVISARMSVEGNKLAFVERDNIQHLWISLSNGRKAKQITTDDIFVTEAKFSPDKKHIAAVIGDVDWTRKESHLVLMERDGSNRRALTSGSIHVGSCTWSTNGEWIAFSSRPVSAPEESSMIYLIKPFAPSTPRLVGRGREVQWGDNGNLVVGMKDSTLWYSISSGLPYMIYRQDSTFATQLSNRNELLLRDRRKGREGIWVVSTGEDTRASGVPKKILALPPLSYSSIPRGKEFVLHKLFGEERFWRTWIPSGREELLGIAFDKSTWIEDLSEDGEEVLWIKVSAPSQLVMVGNVFE